MRLKLLLAISVLAIVGCAKAPPQCTSPETIGLAKQVVISKFKNIGANLRYFSNMAFGDPDVQVTDEMLMKVMEVENPISTSVQKEIKKVMCQATLTTSDVNRGQFFSTTPISYFSQLDDKNEHVVGLSADDTELTKYLMGLYSSVAKSNPSLVKKEDTNSKNPELQAQPASTVTTATSTSTSERPDWCPKAATFVEKTVCNDAELSNLDLQMGRLYAKAKANAKNLTAFQKESKDWLVNQRNKCTDRECLVKTSQDRIRQLSAIAN
jgi:uncharacterized protein YecT (DUF1311 family)